MSAPRKRRKQQPEPLAQPEVQASNGAHAELGQANGHAPVHENGHENGHAFDHATACETAPIELLAELSSHDASADGDAEHEPAEERDPATLQAQGDRVALKHAIESLIFVSDRIVTAAQLGRAVKARAAVVRELIAELIEDYAGRGIELIEVGNGYQFRSSAACAPYVREFVAQKPVRLTRAQLETLALIAYRQPITRPEIDEIRGVDSGSAMRVLLERSLIKMLGRKDEPGRPLLYGTAPEFLEFFGMRSLRELPTLREFTELNEENRALFKRKTGEEVAGPEADLAAAEEAARVDDEGESAHVSDEDLAALAAEADAEAAESTAGQAPDRRLGMAVDASPGQDDQDREGTTDLRDQRGDTDRAIDAGSDSDRDYDHLAMEPED